MIGIYHNKDLDGYCSGAIIKRKFPEAQMVGYDYGEPIPNVRGADKIVMADVSFPMETMFDLADYSDFTWIDHHASAISDFRTWSAKEEYQLDNPIRAVLQDGVSACELTWDHLFPDVEMPLAVELLGEYDTWRNQDKDRWDNIILPFQFGMRLHCNSLETFPTALLKQGTVYTAEIDRIIEMGKTILQYQRQFNETQCRNSFEAKIFGLRAICLNAGGFNSDLFKSVYDPHKHDLMAMFQWNGNTWSVSIYTTRDSIDCSALAKGMGGGGHRKAAGFKTDDINFIIKK